MIQMIVDFFNHPFFIIFGGITASLSVIGVLLSIVFWVLGIGPLLLRLGFGRWFRKISIASNPQEYNNLKNDLVDSGIFRKDNIEPQISSQSFSKISSSDLVLVHYQSFSEEEIKKILSYKKHKSGMIFYFPEFSPREGKVIPDNIVKEINANSNTIIVNMRGRLLNDILTLLITTSYEKR